MLRGGPPVLRKIRVYVEDQSPSWIALVIPSS